MKKPQPAYEAHLGLSGDYTADDVNAAFRAAAKRGHADHGGNLDMGVLKACRDRALAAARAREGLTDCVKCGGTGFKRGTGFAPTRCTNCQGTGKQRRD